MRDKALILQNINKTYRQADIVIEVLKNINLEVSVGELVAIIGSSGSGKSTLLHIAGLLDTADSGVVQITQKHKSSDHDSIRLNDIGFVYQYHHLLNNFTARENIALPKLIAGSNYQQALMEADHLLDSLGLIDRKNNMPGELSGGEQQRVAIARSLINQPKIILADEPTGNLDPQTAGEVFNLLLKLADQQKIAMLIVTHNHLLAQRMHHIYELSHGSLKKHKLI